MNYRAISMTVAAVVWVQPSLAQAQDTRPAVAAVQTFSDALIDSMKAGASITFSQRVARLAPVIERSFDLPLTTRLAVGPAWSTFSASDQTALVAAIRRMTIAEYARNFSRWNGEMITVDGKPNVRGGDALVRTTLSRKGKEPVVISYRMRQSGGRWRIVDVLFNGSVSQLATRRSDYAAIVKRGGAKALIAHLNAAADKAAR